MEEKESQARALLDKTNRQFNECNALYHAAAMVKKGLLALCPGKGAHSGKIVTLTAEGRALAERTVVPVIAAEEKAIRAFGLASAEEMHRLAQRHLECLQREFEKIAR